MLTGAAIQGASASTTLLLLAYAAGAATSLAVALLIGGRVFAAMKKSLGAGEWIRRGLGRCGAARRRRHRVRPGHRLSHAPVARQHRAHRAGADRQGAAVGQRTQDRRASPEAICRSKGTLPSLAGATAWLNSPPLTPQALRGKVVLVDFWTYSCINCLRSLPYVKAWAAKYKDHGLVVIGVHAPEFAFEKRSRQCAPRGARSWRHLSGRARQQSRDLAGLQQRILARALFHRRAGPHPRASFRRRRIRRVRSASSRRC